MPDQTRRDFLRRAGASAAAIGLGGAFLAACGSDSDAGGSSGAAAEGAITIGLLQSLSGVLSITEKSMYDGSMLAVDEINAAGGINGRKLKVVTEDYASDMTVAVQKAEKLIREDKAAIVIGGYTSASRVAMVPTFQKSDALLFYGTYYEGLECDTNTFYSGAVPNQFLLDYVPWITKNLGASIYVVGSDYVYPKTVSAIVKKLAPATGGRVIADRYFQLGTTDFGSVISDIKRRKPDVVISNLVGDSTPAFYKQYRAAGLTAENLPIAATVTTEVEVQAMAPADAAGHYQTSTYFQSLDNPANTKFVAAFKKRYGQKAVTHMPLVGNYNAVHLFADAVRRADGLSTAALSTALVGATFDGNPEGRKATMGANHHTDHPSYVGQTNAQGQFDVVATFDPRPADPFPAQLVAAGRAPTCPTPFKG